MTITRLFLAIGMLCAVAVAAYEPAGSNAAQQDPAKTGADQADAAKGEDLDIKYARLTLALANLELQRATEINKQVPGTFTRTSLAAFEQSVVINEEQLKALTQKGGVRAPMFLIAAEATAKATQQQLQRVLTINQQVPGTITPIEVDRARLTADLANVTLEKARTVNPKNEAQFLQWQVDQLREELYLLRIRVAQLSRLN